MNKIIQTHSVINNMCVYLFALQLINNVQLSVFYVQVNRLNPEMHNFTSIIVLKIALIQ